MIQTEIWVKHPEKPGILTFVGYRDAKDVFDEVHNTVRAKYEHDEKVGFDYIALDWDYKNKGAKWPKGYIAVFAMPGGSEAYRVNVCVLSPIDGYKQMMSAKVWSEEGAHEVCKFIQRLFYFETYEQTQPASIDIDTQGQLSFGFVA